MFSPEEIDKVRLLLSTSGWNDVMRPRIENRLKGFIKLLVLHPSERAEEHRDDSALRVRIQELEWMLVSWQNEITVADANRMGDELAQASLMNGTEEIGSATPANP